MSRDLPKAPTVGHCRCPNPHCGKTAAIRRNRSGKYYAVCQGCGPIYWLTPEGQEFFLNEGTIWGSAGAPADLPAWIREGKVAPRAHPPAQTPEPSATKTESNTSTSSIGEAPAALIKPATQSKTVKPMPVSQPKPATRPWWQF